MTPEQVSSELEKFKIVSRETIRDLQVFADMLMSWNKKINLVARSSVQELWCRHIIDSAQIYPLMAKNQKFVADLGTGGGFPGVILAIISKHLYPDRTFTFLESDQRKCAFLQMVSAKLDLAVDIDKSRIEEAAPKSANLITARALAPLSALFELSERHLAANGEMIFLKGENAEKEVEDARVSWDFELDTVQSQTSPSGKILRIRTLTRA